jgi:quinol monooxygenase YgiN
MDSRLISVGRPSFLTQWCQEQPAKPQSPEQEAQMNHALEHRLIMIAELTIKPDMRDAFLDYTVDNLSISRAAAGNISFDILIDENRPDQVLFYEVWESAEAQQAYMAWRIERGDLTTLMAFLADQPKFTALRRIA